MHRFWVFPLVLGFVGALYPVLCMAESMFAIHYLVPPLRRFDWSAEVQKVFWECLPYGVGAGVLLGLGAAWREYGRPGAVPQGGEAAATRLLANVGWLLLYALLFNASIWAVLLGAARSGWVSPRTVTYYFPGGLFLVIGFVNLVAIVWAARRTAHTNDWLSPRVWFAKLGATTQMTPRTRKPSRHEREI